MSPNKTINCTGMFCPMPVVKTKLQMETMQKGEILEIIADDPGFEKDLPAWCGMASEKFLEIKKEGNIIKGYVMKN